MTVTLGQYTIGTKKEEQKNKNKPVAATETLLAERNSSMKEFYENDNLNENENTSGQHP